MRELRVKITCVNSILGSKKQSINYLLMLCFYYISPEEELDFIKELFDEVQKIQVAGKGGFSNEEII
ncbi:MAG: hypothetical protein K2J90_13580 [Lachnospiraceae bacterium]|nr:hypothetical protein [Lachnospiraceae bacterium]